MIRIQEFTCNQMKLEQFLNVDAVRLGWKVLSVQKNTLYPFAFWGIDDTWIVTFEVEEV